MLPGDTLAWLCSRGPLNVSKGDVAMWQLGACCCMNSIMRLP